MEKEVIVANSSSLIFIAKLDIFNLAKNKFKKILVPRQVMNEIFKKRTAETLIIKRELNSFVNEVVVKKIKEIPVDEGERAAISFCLNNNKKIFLSDDKKARRFARSFKLETIGTLGILLWNLEHRKMKKQEFIDLLNNLIKNGFYISLSVYSNVMKLVEMLNI